MSNERRLEYAGRTKTEAQKYGLALPNSAKIGTGADRSPKDICGKRSAGGTGRIFALRIASQ